MNRTEAQKFLDALYSRFKGHYVIEVMATPPGDFVSDEIEWVWIDPDNPEPFDYIEELNKDHNIWFGVNPRRTQRNASEKDIKDIICFWADLDSKEFEGGKPEALEQINKFKLRPSIIIDSGHGYHLYWILREPLIDINQDEFEQVRQIESGIRKKLRGDSNLGSPMNHLRLPGTMNVKYPEAPVLCSIVELNERLYVPFHFEEFRDHEWIKAEQFKGPIPDFGEVSVIIRNHSSDHAGADVNKLRVSKRVKNLILSGDVTSTKDGTRSGRDFVIIIGLIQGGYTFQTIDSIFSNPHLRCSNRLIRNKRKLAYDVNQALEWVEEHRPTSTKEADTILLIRGEKATHEEKRQAILEVITDKLFTGENHIAKGLLVKEMKNYYIFDLESKELTVIDVKNWEFTILMKMLFSLPHGEMEDVAEDLRKSVTKYGQVASLRRVSYFDKDNFILYVYNNKGQMYKLDGSENIELIDNGEDEVFFDQDMAGSPFEYLKETDVRRYFKKDEETGKWGLDPAEYKDSLIFQHLISRASFEEDELTVEEQKVLLFMYFFSLYFESIMPTKPIACFIGKAGSGKSTISTMIGKILVGAGFMAQDLSSKKDSLEMSLAYSHFIVLDNVERKVNEEILSLLNDSATGTRIRPRKLYTHMLIEFVPHCFVGITSVSGEFRDNEALVSRLLLFKNKLVEEGEYLDIEDLYEPLIYGRNEIMTEVLENLDGIVRILRDRITYKPKVMTRLASFERFCRKLLDSGDAQNETWREIMLKLSKAKTQFALEDDLLVIAIRNYLKRGSHIEDMPAQEMWLELSELGNDLEKRQFERAYKTPAVLGKRLRAIEADLEKLFGFRVDVVHHQRFYTIELKD